MVIATRTFQFCRVQSLCPTEMGDLAKYEMLDYVRKKIDTSAFNLSRSQHVPVANGSQLKLLVLKPVLVSQ